MAMIDEIKEQTMKMKEMNGKQRWEYFWEYYKFYVLGFVCVLFILISMTKDILKNKEMIFNVAVFNADTDAITTEYTDAWAAELGEKFEINTKKETVTFDTSYVLSNERNTSFDMSTLQKVMVLAGSRELDIVVGNKAVFEYYAQLEFFADLKDVLTAEQYARLEPYFYYTDGATFGDDETVETMQEAEKRENEKLAMSIDHHDPSTMEKPIAVGLFVENSEKLAESGAYEALGSSDILYQGYPEEGVVGVAIGTKHVEYVQKFMDYFY